MRNRQDIEAKLAEIEKKVWEIRNDKKNAASDEHLILTEQMATLRWCLDKNCELDEGGLRDS
jgi:hypothetical protein